MGYKVTHISNTYSDAQYLIFANMIDHKWICHKKIICKKYTTDQLKGNSSMGSLKVDGSMK